MLSLSVIETQWTGRYDTLTMLKRQNQLCDCVHFALSQKLFISNRWYRWKHRIQHKREKNLKKNSSSNCTRVHRNRAHLIRPFYRRKRIILCRLFSVHRFISIAIARKIVLKTKKYFPRNEKHRTSSAMGPKRSYSTKSKKPLNKCWMFRFSAKAIIVCIIQILWIASILSSIENHSKILSNAPISNFNSKIIQFSKNFSCTTVLCVSI